MFDERFRALLAGVMAGPVRTLARVGVSPNQVTVAGGLLGAAGGLLVARGHPMVGLATWLGSRVLDGMDGVLARATGRGSAFGGYLDITFDMFAYSAMLLGIGATRPEGGVVWQVILAGYLLVSTSTLALAATLEATSDKVVRTDRSIRFTPGFAEAGETTLTYTLLVLLPGFTVPIAWTWVVLLGATAVQRTLLARRLLG